MILTKIVSSLEKCFFDSKLSDFQSLKQISMLKNERLSVQLLYAADETEEQHTKLKLTVIGAPALHCTLRTVEHVPVKYAVPLPVADDNFLRTAPGLYPDVLQPLHYNGRLTAMRGYTQCVWIEFDPQEKLAADKYSVAITLTRDNGEIAATELLELEIIDASLPEQEMIFTQWFHCDCLANYYGCEVWSEKHWEIIENFAKTAVRNGINMLLTPVHTPPLDTAVGGERLTNQLVDVTLNDGEYSFGFERLDRWIDMCDRIGIKYFEIAHFFTQWGAEHAPKIMATVNGIYKQLFGWDTDAVGEAYSAYLHAFIPAFLDHMKARGDDRRCYFHISDEPNKKQLDSYRAAKNVVKDLLEGYPIMDALSNFEYWSEGIVETPIPANNHIAPFVEAKVPGLWTYYCCAQFKDVSNRFISMPLWRTRSIGVQFYKYDIVGFLQWGYNFYSNCRAVDLIDPYMETSGDYWVSAGDTHSVYPAQNGTALESVRILSFYEALQDARALRLAEQYRPKAELVAEMERLFGDEIRFDRCFKDAETLLKVREYINGVIRAGVSAE